MTTSATGTMTATGTSAGSSEAAAAPAVAPATKAARMPVLRSDAFGRRRTARASSSPVSVLVR